MRENNLVVQHNAVIEARYKLTVEEQRLIKTLASKIQPSDEDFKTYEIRISELADLLGIADAGYYDRVKKVTKKIMSNTVCFPDEFGNDIQTNWLSSAKYYKGKGVVALRFDPELKPYLLQLKKFFTSYELGNILRLNGMYSIRIYELLKQYEKIGSREFDLDVFRQTLRIDEGYQQYRDLKKWVLVPAGKEISEKTDIAYSLSERKVGRKVVGLVFNIKPNAANGPETKGHPVDAGPPRMESPGPLISQLLNLGVSKRTAEKMVGTHSGERIKSAIDYTEGQRKEGKVKNPAGFLVEAIRNGYQDGQAEQRQRKTQTAQRAAQEEARRKDWEALKARWNAWRQEQTEAHVAALSPEALEREKAAFRESIADNFAMKKLTGKSAESEARHFLLYLTGQMTGLALKDWAESAGVDLRPFQELARLEGKL